MPDPSELPTSARIEVFRTGRFTSMEGAPLSYSAADLKAIAAAYDPQTAPVPVVVGHPTAEAPAFGWVERFDYEEANDRLNAVLKEIEPSFAAAVQAGRFKKVSLRFFPPHHPANPTPGQWYPMHVGFLGAAPPGVPGLKNVSFSVPAAEAITFEGEFASFGDPGFERSASIFRRLRDFFIAEHGLEKADQVLPAYEIEWLSEMESPPGPSAVRSFSAVRTELAVLPTPPIPKKETPMSALDAASFAVREANLTAREQLVDERERVAAHADNVSFAARLVEEGRLLPLSQDKVVAILDGLPGEQTVSFAAGEAAIPTAEAIRQVLQEQPVVVSFGRIDTSAAPGAEIASFAADGRAVNPEKLVLHAKAEAYMRQHPSTSYSDAIKAVS